MPRLAALLVLVSVAVGCRTPPIDFDGGLPPGASDLAVGVSRDLAASRPRDLHATPTSCCGAPGNPGNELGVGLFCQTSTDCASVQASTCASTFAPNLNFCTKSCVMGGGTAQCGSGAQCQCAQGQCACIPGECVMPPPGC
jgi:hypothetical protein